MDYQIGDGYRDGEHLDFFDDHRLVLRSNGFDHFPVICILRFPLLLLLLLSIDLFIFIGRRQVSFEAWPHFFLFFCFTCSDEEDVVVFAVGRFHLRVHFDLRETVTAK